MSVETWDAKDPDEQLDYRVDWSADLNTGDVITNSTFELVTAAGVSIVVQGFTDTDATCLIAGGTSGLTAVIKNTVMTAANIILETVILLPIVSNEVSYASPTGYIMPTPGNLKARFAPVFNSVDPGRLQIALTNAARQVDNTWTEGDYAEAIMQLAAHFLTREGVGTSAAAQFWANGGVVKREKGADHEIEIAVNSAITGGGSGSDPFASTPYGQEFIAIRRRNFSGVTVAAGSGCGYSYAATDWPFAYPPPWICQ